MHSAPFNSRNVVTSTRLFFIGCFVGLCVFPCCFLLAALFVRYPSFPYLNTVPLRPGFLFARDIFWVWFLVSALRSAGHLVDSLAAHLGGELSEEALPVNLAFGYGTALFICTRVFYGDLYRYTNYRGHRYIHGLHIGADYIGNPLTIYTIRLVKKSISVIHLSPADQLYADNTVTWINELLALDPDNDYRER